MRTVPVSLVALGLAACSAFGKRSDEALEPACTETRSTVALDEATPLGITAADVLALAEGEWSTTLTWADTGGTTGLAVAVARAAEEATYVDQEPAEGQDTGLAPALAAECPDRIEVAVDFGFVTDDGAFDEAWSAALVGDEAGAASIVMDIDQDALMGTWRFDDPDYADFDDIRVTLDAGFDGVEPSGRIRVSGSKDNGCDTGGTCSAEAFSKDVAAFGPDSE